jgi:predicted DNA-binding protein
MSTVRTQVYLTDEQRRRIDAASKAEGLTMAEIIRRALDAYLSDDLEPTRALAATFGAQPSASVPSRDTWHRG